MALAKNTSEYWKSKIFKEERQGAKSANYYMRVRKDGVLHRFNLESGNQLQASKKAAEIYIYFRANGIDEALEKYKEKKLSHSSVKTVGDIIRVYEDARILNPTTLTEYRRKFYRLVSGIKGFRSDGSKHDHHNGLDVIWRKRVEAVRLVELTPNKINKWKNQFIGSMEFTPQERKSAAMTVSSILRNSKSLFSSKHLKALGIKNLENPFEGVEIGKATTRRYISKINAKELVGFAKNELWVEIPSTNRNHIAIAHSKREQFKILLLGLVAGLRREEIDLLMWDQVDLGRGRIHVCDNKYGTLKTENSEREIDLPPAVVELLGEWKRTTLGEFVVWSETDPKPNASYHHYRCGRHYRNLVFWLREKGVSLRNPIHGLRKEYGSLICEQAGIYAASMALGHSDIRITQASYLDTKKKVVVDVF